MGKKKNEKEYSVYFPDFDLATSGVDEQDVINSAKELLNVTIHGMRKEKLKMPKPTSLEKIKVDKNEFVKNVSIYALSI